MEYRLKLKEIKKIFKVGSEEAEGKRKGSGEYEMGV